MKERIKVIDFKYKITILTFLFFLIITSLAPISGGDWNSYLIGKGGFISSIKNMNLNDGRIISGFLINFLSYHKPLFNLIFSYLMSLFVHCVNNAMGYVKNKYFYLFPFIGLLLVSTFTFSYNYVSITSAVAYTFPSLLTFLYFSYIWRKTTFSFTIKEYILLTLMAIYISLSSIHISTIFLLGNILFYLKMVKSKKSFPKAYSFIIIFQILSFILSLLSIDKSLFYGTLDEGVTNITRYIDTIFSRNIILIIIGAIPINYYLNDKLETCIYKRVIITLFDLILIFSLAYNFYNYSPVNLNLIINKYFGVFAVENWYYIFYFITYLILFFLSLNYIIKNRKTKQYLNLFFMMSFIVSIFSIISPIWDEGNNIFILLFIIFSNSIILKELDIKIYKKLVIVSTIILLIYYISMMMITKYIDVTRKEYIEEQLKYDEQIIEVKANPIYLVWRYNPVTIFQQKDFKKYYNIPQDKELDVKYLGIFEKIERKIKE